MDQPFLAAMYMYIYVYIYVCVCVCVCMHMSLSEHMKMPELPPQLLLLRETGMVQHRPAKMIKCGGSPLHLECLILLLQQRTNMKSK